MKKYNNRIRMRDLFMNEKLAGVFPQFVAKDTARGAYTLAEIKTKVCEYLAAALNGTVTGAGELSVNGNQRAVLSRVQRLQPLIESLYNNMPKVAQALRNNATLYLPYATRKQIEDIRSTDGKIKAMQAVMDNFQYNDELGTLNSVRKEKPEQFARNKKQWERKVGYRRLKKV